jgi:hypothetical protein
MRTYRIVWGAIVAALVCIGAAAGILFVPVTVSVMVFVCGAALDLGLRLAIADTAVPDRRALAAVCTRDGFAMLAFAGYCGAIGVVALPLLGLAVVTAPSVLKALPTWFGARSAAEETLAVDDTLPLSNLSEHDLCVVWRRSCKAVRKAETSYERMRIVARRQAYLDELERRRPEAFATWLEIGPDATDPSTIFSTKGHGHREQ